MHTVTSADGTEIAYDRHGEGPPLVLLHGSSATSDSWKPVIPHLSDAFTVITPDRRGRGGSGDAGAYGLDREVADLRAVLDAIADDPTFDSEPTVLGHSYGGLVTLSAVLDGMADGEPAFPVEGLVLYEPSILVGEHAEDDLADRMATLLAEGDRLGALRLFMEDGGGVPDVEQLPWWPEEANVDLVDTVVRENYEVEAFDLPADPEVGVPTLLLTGERGPAHLKAAIEELDARLSGNEFVELDGIGHAANASAPRDLAAVIRKFALESPASEV